MNETTLREQITLYGKSLFDRGLTMGSSGNISVRVDDGWLMTPTISSTPFGSEISARLESSARSE